jgi:uncharacterized protein YigA (DUF484 family)
MSDKSAPIHPVDSFTVLSALAHLGATSTDLYSLLRAALHTSMEHLPLAGMAVWLRSSEQDVLTPGISYLPSVYATSAIAEDAPLLQRLQDKAYLLLDSAEAAPLIEMPDAETVLALAPIRSADLLLGLLGYVGPRADLLPWLPLLTASANVLSGPMLSMWIRRQQAEADDVEATLSEFAAELRGQRGLDDILRTLNNKSLRAFDCDWSAVYLWQEQGFVPVQIMTRVGEQPLKHEPTLRPAENPVLEVVLEDARLLALPDLREQPSALPDYAQHALRGVVLVPLHKANESPLGLLVLGYRAPLSTFGSRATALSQGLARMVTVALSRTRHQQG